MHNGGRQDTVFQCLKNLLYPCDIYGYVSWSYAARYFSQETFKLFKCPDFIFVVLSRAAYLKISGSLWVIVLREGLTKWPERMPSLCFVRHTCLCLLVIHEYLVASHHGEDVQVRRGGSIFPISWCHCPWGGRDRNQSLLFQISLSWGILQGF